MSNLSTSVIPPHYSWIPNLTGSLNFEYISDNIVQEDDEHQLYQSTESSTIKYFLFENIDFSDGIEKSKKGLPRTIVCKIEKQATKFCAKYNEYIYDELDAPSKQTLDDIISKVKHNRLTDQDFKSLPTPLIEAIADIDFNGVIKLEFPIVRILTVGGKQFSNIPLITYRAIKYILHKDIFHSEEDDNIVGIYSNKKGLEDNILKHMLKYIKSYERLLKDDIKVARNRWARKTFYMQLIIKTEGILTYMKSLQLIHNNTKLQVDLAVNVIDSMKHMVTELENSHEPIVWGKEIYAYAAVLLISTSILITGMLPERFKPLDSYYYYSLSLFLPIILSLIVFYEHTIKRLAYHKYIGESHKSAEVFIRKRLREHSDEIHRRAVHSSIAAVIVIIIYVVVKLDLFTRCKNFFI